MQQLIIIGRQLTKPSTNLSTTLYQQVEAAIEDMIRAHRLRPGEALPSEKELEVTYGVSRITVRRALEELERKGQVVRSKGRSARVAQPLLAHARTHLSDDFITMLDLVRGTAPEILIYEWQLPDEETYSYLELTTDEPVLHVDRIRRKNGRPTLHTAAHVPAFIGVKLQKEELAKTSMLELLAQSGNHSGPGRTVYVGGSVQREYSRTTEDGRRRSDLPDPSDRARRCRPAHSKPNHILPGR